MWLGVAQRVVPVAARVLKGEQLQLSVGKTAAAED
jgi:hypothetical protein